MYPEGIRHIRADKRVNEWRTPGKRAVVRCALNERQVVIALTGGEIVYFEMDASGQLNEYTERKEMNCDVVSMSLGTVPPGEQRSRFLAVGLADQTVRIISLDPSVSQNDKDLVIGSRNVAKNNGGMGSIVGPSPHEAWFLRVNKPPPPPPPIPSKP